MPPYSLADVVAVLGEAAGAVLQPTERRSFEHWMAVARRALGAPAAAAAWAGGRAMTLEQAIAYALEEPPEQTASGTG